MPIVKTVGPKTRDNIVTYLGIDVYEAAKRRIRHCLNVCDSLVVAFSGGKDSLALLHLVKEVYEEDGINKPVEAIFRDEELIPDVVIDFVDEYRRQPWLNLRWFAVPMASHKFILGKTMDYTQWDPARPWVRQKPEWAITECQPGVIYDQYTMDEYVSKYFPGKIAMMTGIRCSESIFRYRAIINKVNDTVLAGTKSCPRMMLGRAIYDWSETDIFKFFYDKAIRYCMIYDWQNLNGEALRVSTPIHAEAAKRLSNLRTRDPVFYDRLLTVFPEMGIQELYFKDLDNTALILAYGQTWEGVFRYIDENITDEHQHKLATQRVAQSKAMGNGYSPEYVFKAVLSGRYKRVILPEGK